MKTTINIKDFISSNENEDVGAIIQEKLDELSKGGTLFFPKRTYCISKTIFFYSNQNLIFEEGAILKRIASPDTLGSRNLTCGCFLCNWFETSDTFYTSTVEASCENVRIVGATFDMGSKAELNSDSRLKDGVAPINTCNAKNIYIENSIFKNNYTAHCIEINSSKNVYISDCVFKDYLGRVDFGGSANDDKLYNEMIQIDKATNAALGTKYDGSTASIRGYDGKVTSIAVSSSETSRPTYKACDNINIFGCIFETNSRCVAIGNHHEIANSDTAAKKYNTALHTNINIYENIFYGETSERGHIAFDNFTTKINIYKCLILIYVVINKYNINYIFIF